MKKKATKQTTSTDFSLQLDGPADLMKLRIFAALMIVWLPLLILALIDGTAISGVKIPFLYDISTYTRLIIALALFIAAEGIVDNRIGEIVAQFSKRHIISEINQPRFNQIIKSLMTWRKSIWIEVLLILFVFTFGHWIWKQYTVFAMPTWYATTNDGEVDLTPAGCWNLFISLPIFQFVIMRWYFRFAIWYRFLWQVSRLPLQLNSLHPDRAGGLGFLAKSVYAFSPVLIAHTVLLAGIIANRIAYTGAKLTDFKLEIVGVVGFLVLLVILPLFFFLLPLARAKRTGTLQYGSVASKYVDDFKRKWLNSNNETNADLLGSSDIQSLADLANSYEVTNKMGVTPFGMSTLLQLVVLTSLPLLPLTFTMIPFEEMISRAIKILL